MPVPQSPSPSASPLPVGDGVLTIGTLFPTSGAMAFLGPAQVAGVELAVRDINTAGGVNGQPVVVHHRSSGDASTDQAEESLASLLEKEVDVIIGPSSSVLAERLLPAVLEADLTMITPSATAPVLSSLDDEDRLFQVISSADSAAAALAASLKGTVGIVYYADDEGRAMKRGLEEALGDRVVTVQGYLDGLNSVAGIVSWVQETKPDAVVLTGSGDAAKLGQSIIKGLVDAGFGGEKLWLTSQLVADYSQIFTTNGYLTGVHGIIEGTNPDAEFVKRVRSADPSVTSFRYAAEAYDATILAALAAELADNDASWAIADRLVDVSRDGILCTSYGECLAVLAQRPDIDYDGVSGRLTLDERGALAISNYSLFRYTDARQVEFVGQLTAE